MIRGCWMIAVETGWKMIYGVRALILQLAEEYLTAEQEEEEEEMNAAAQADIKWLSIHSRYTP